MVKVITLLVFLVMSLRAFASHHQIIDTLGTSPKGQFVALEEYGYKRDAHTYYVTIRVMNVWKKEYVGTPIRVELPAHRPNFLNKARERAKLMAQEELKRFQISG